MTLYRQNYIMTGLFWSSGTLLDAEIMEQKKGEEESGISLLVVLKFLLWKTTISRKALLKWDAENLAQKSL